MIDMMLVLVYAAGYVGVASISVPAEQHILCHQARCQDWTLAEPIHRLAWVSFTLWNQGAAVGYMRVQSSSICAAQG